MQDDRVDVGPDVADRPEARARQMDLDGQREDRHALREPREQVEVRRRPGGLDGRGDHDPHEVDDDRIGDDRSPDRGDEREEKVLDAIIDTALNVDVEAGVAGTVGRFSEALEAGIWPLEPKIRVATVRLVDATERWPAIRAAFDRFLTVAVERLTYGAIQDQTADASVATSRRGISPRCSSRWRPAPSCWPVRASAPRARSSALFS
jgi:hypothetical protein